MEQALRNLNEISEKFSINTKFIIASKDGIPFISTEGGLYHDENEGDFDIGIKTYFKCERIDQKGFKVIEILELYIDGVNMDKNEIFNIGDDLGSYIHTRNVFGGYRLIKRLIARFSLGDPHNYHTEEAKQQLIKGLKFLQKFIR